MKSIIIDAGHGGKDNGATAFGVKEKDWTLKMSLYQHRRLQELGAKVSLTRPDDVTLEPHQRVAKVKNRYDICISNHFNVFNGKARGVETIHSIHSSPVLAQAITEQIVVTSGLPLRRVFSRKTLNQKSDYYFMHRLTGSTKTVIVEYGFIDHKADFTFYNNDEKFYRVAESVVQVLCEHLKIPYSAPRTAKLDFSNKQLKSIHSGKLRFYNKPSWNTRDVYGFLEKGQEFKTVAGKVKVGNGYQYKVQNAKGETYFITANPQYVKLINK